MNHSLNNTSDLPLVDLPLVDRPPESNTRSTDALMAITSRPDAVMVRGAGSLLWDDDGKEYLDFIQGWAVNALGHCPTEVVATITAQAAELITPSPALHNAPQLELATSLAKASGLAQVHFTSTGAEANEAAVKLARKWGRLHKSGAARIVTTEGAFHGRTLAMMAASGKPGWDQKFPPLPEGFHRVPFGCSDAMREAITDDTVAIMVEPIQGEAGVVVPADRYLSALREIADEHNILLVFDEIQTGMGRTGALFCHQHTGIQPDIMTLGKGLGGGVPLAAVLAGSRACCFEPGDQGGTYNGNPLMTAVGCAVLETVNDPVFLNRVRDAGNRIRGGLQRLARGGEVRGKGLLWAMRLPDSTALEVADRAFELGLLINPAQPDVLRLMPSLRVTDAEIDSALALLALALDAG